jgi:hypothetical protein
MKPEPGLTGFWIGFSDLDFWFFRILFVVPYSLDRIQTYSSFALLTRALMLHFQSSAFTTRIVNIPKPGT